MYIAYRFSNVPTEDLYNLINPIFNLLRDNNIDVFCNLYYDNYYIENSFSVKQIMNHCFENIDKKDTILCLIDTNEYSCGMLLELGYSLKSKKNIIVCCREGCEIDTVIEMANSNIIYSDYGDLLEKIIQNFNLIS